MRIIHKGIDIAKWNTINSYEDLKADGVEFAILKAINKANRPDDLFIKHVNGCTNADINILGTYHYSYSQTMDQAKKAVTEWLLTAGDVSDTFFLDWEQNGLPTGAAGVNIIRTYADAILSEGKKFKVYTYLSWYNSYLKAFANQLPYDFWIARYYSGTDVFKVDSPINEKFVPNIKNELIGWQYTSNGIVNGASGRLDLNAWFEKLIPHLHQNENSDIINMNPFMEPTSYITLGSKGEGALWTNWCLWRFGLLLTNGVPDFSKVTAVINDESYRAIIESQKILGAKPDGVVGIITRTLYKKVLA